MEGGREARCILRESESAAEPSPTHIVRIRARRPINILRIWNFRELTQSDSYFRGVEFQVHMEFPQQLDSDILSLWILITVCGLARNNPRVEKFGCFPQPLSGGISPLKK